MTKLTLAKATGGGLPKDTIARLGSVFLATCFAVMLVGQLFAFEKMPGMLTDYGLFDQSNGLIAAAVIVVLELATLPVLLHVPLSKLARMCGWIAGALVLDIWIFLVCYALVTNASPQAGIFGANVPLHLGWGMLLFLVSVSGMYLVVYTRLYMKGRWLG